MPELPEVETIVRELREAQLIGAKIIMARVFWNRSIDPPNSHDFIRRIADQTIVDIHRRGKNIIFTLSKETLIVHLRMTGKFSIVSSNQCAPLKHERVQLCLADGRIIRFEDQRKFGKWHLSNNPLEKLSKLGVEPLSDDFSLQRFKTLLSHRKSPIKSFLLDQKYIVGLGNIYVDEALWEAKIHPLRRISTLSDKEIRALYTAIPKVLKQGIANMGTTLGSSQANYYSVSGRKGSNQHKLNVFRREQQACPRCGETILKTVVGQRGTHFCPNCQT